MFFVSFVWFCSTFVRQCCFLICFCMILIDSVAKHLLFTSFCKFRTRAHQKHKKHVNLRVFYDFYSLIKKKRKLCENARGNPDFVKISQNLGNSYKNLYKTKQNLPKSHNAIRNHIKSYNIWMRNILQHLTKYYKSIQHLRKRKQSNTTPYKTICENAILSASVQRSLCARALGERSKREL